MGFESKVSGYIASNLSGRESVSLIQAKIDQLPDLENDQWPFLPKDIFRISAPINPEAMLGQIAYRSIMIHFAMSVKQLEDDLKVWMDKFEAFFKSIPGAYEVNLDISLSPFTGRNMYKNGNLNYNWLLDTNLNHWIYQGDPTEFKAICEPMNYINAYFSPAFKEKVIEHLEWLAAQTGKKILITDMITTKKGVYDRHFTTTNRFELTLKHFGIRMSGAIGMIDGGDIRFEFHADRFRRIEKRDNELEIESALDLHTSRLIKIIIKNP